MDPHPKICPQRDRDSQSPSEAHRRIRYRSIRKSRPRRYRSIRKSRPSRYVMDEMRDKHIAIRGCYGIAIFLSIIALCIALITSTDKSSNMFHVFMALSLVAILCGPLLIRRFSALHEDNCYEDLSGTVFKFNFTPNWPLRLAFVSIAVSLLIVVMGIHHNGDSIKTYYNLSRKADWDDTPSQGNKNPKNVDFIDDAIDSIFSLFGI